MVTKLSTAAEAMAAAGPGPRAAEVLLPRQAEFPGRSCASTHKVRAEAVSASGRSCGKMAAAVTARVVTVAFAGLASACSRSCLRVSGPGAGETGWRGEKRERGERGARGRDCLGAFGADRFFRCGECSSRFAVGEPGFGSWFR